MTAELEVLASGYQLVEAPRVDAGGRVWFTDVLGGGVHRWSDGVGDNGCGGPGTVETIVPKRRGVGGMALHADGGVVIGGRDIIHVTPDGTNRTLLSAPDDVTGFNDLCATPTGGIVVGALRFRPFAGEEPVPGMFLRLEDGDPAPVEVVQDVLWPNGCGFIDDRLYVCDYRTGDVVVRDGSEQRVHATSPSGEADGLAVDREGGVWIALGSRGGVARIAPDGRIDQIVDGLASFVTSLAFSADGETMYITTAAAGDEPGVLGRLPAPTPGVAHPLATL